VWLGASKCEAWIQAHAWVHLDAARTQCGEAGLQRRGLAATLLAWRRPMVRSHCRSRNRYTECVSDSGTKRMSSTTKRQCDRALRRPAARALRRPAGSLRGHGAARLPAAARPQRARRTADASCGGGPASCRRARSAEPAPPRVMMPSLVGCTAAVWWC
jgi:hypothetical protein